MEAMMFFMTQSQKWQTITSAVFIWSHRTTLLWYGRGLHKSMNPGGRAHWGPSWRQANSPAKELLSEAGLRSTVRCCRLLLCACHSSHDPHTVTKFEGTMKIGILDNKFFDQMNDDARLIKWLKGFVWKQLTEIQTLQTSVYLRGHSEVLWAWQ